ncbi:MAG: TIGR02391 family protein [Anaerolineae bacterium]
MKADLLRRSGGGWLLLFLPVLTACYFNAVPPPFLQAFSLWQAYYVAASRHMNPYTFGQPLSSTMPGKESSVFDVPRGTLGNGNRHTLVPYWRISRTLEGYTAMSEPSVRESVNAYLERVARSRSPSTTRVYRMVMRRFVASLQEHGVDPDSMTASLASEGWLVDFFGDLRNLAPSTERVYRACVAGWYRYLASEGLAIVNIERLRLLVRPYLQELVQPAPQFPSYFDISRIVDYAMGLADAQISNELAYLRALRDRALIVILADTGMEVVTVCSLRRRDIDWKNSRFVLGGKGDDGVFVSFSPRVADALRDYLNARSSLDDAMDCSQSSLPLIAGHRKRVKVVPFQRGGVRNVIAKRAREALGAEYDGTITPKSFRHYFITSVLQPFALLHPKIVNKCQVLFENGLYDQTIFIAMKLVEEEIRSITSSDPEDIGVNLITKAMKTGSSLIRFSSVQAEQESAYFLFRGAIGAFKNPLSHRFLGTSDPVKTLECLALASLLMRMLDEAT